MIHKFHPDKNRWDGVEPHIYKENPGVFREVTKQILFDNENDLPVQFRYFQVEKNGFSSLEHHKHMHAVMIFKGKGHVLLGNQVYAVEEAPTKPIQNRLSMVFLTPNILGFGRRALFHTPVNCLDDVHILN